MSLLGSIIRTGTSFIPVVGPVISGLMPAQDPISGRVSKSEFYSQRDAYYAQINQLYGTGHYENLPGNPFSVFSHSSISDSPIKNYAGELSSLRAMMTRYYPDIMGIPTATAPAPEPVRETSAPPTSQRSMEVDGNGNSLASSGTGKVPVWVWIVGGVVLLFGKKLFR